MKCYSPSPVSLYGLHAKHRVPASESIASVPKVRVSSVRSAASQAFLHFVGRRVVLAALAWRVPVVVAAARRRACVMSGSGYKRLQDGNNVTDDHQQVEDGQHPLERPSLSTACTTTQHHAVRGQHHVRTSPTGASISPGFIARTSTLRSGRVPVHVSASP